MTDFYRAFEERHRGSRAVVKERLRAYVPFLQPLVRGLPAPAAMDLGCGRGEWLELLGELGFRAHGVDLDDAMLEACRTAGLSADHADAIASLGALADGSQAVVSAFHLVEHLPFDAVQALVAEALRVLAPGGLLIMETPNPENIVVATSGFYLDPTHQRPLPPELLAFLPEYHGFARAKTVRLQEPAALHGDAAVSLNDVLGSASPDYGVVAQKQGSAEQMAELDAAFATPFGLDLAELARRYDEGRRAELAVVEDHANRLAQQAHAFEAIVTEIQANAGASVSRIEKEAEALRQRLEETDARLSAASELLASLLDERKMGAVSAMEVGRGAGGLRRWLHAIVESHPELRIRIVRVAQRLRVHGAIRRAYRWVTGRPQAGAVSTDGVFPDLPPSTRRSQEIQEVLEAAMKNKKQDIHDARGD